MLKKLYSRFLTLVLVMASSTPHALDPWFTDPIIALSGKTTPLGSSGLQLYGYYQYSHTIYDIDWQSIRTPQYTSQQIIPELTYGLTDKIDIEYDIPYINNVSDGTSTSNLGDVLILLGFQLLEQHQTRDPYLRLTIQEIFPTGHYDDFKAANYASEGTGAGSYQTAIGLNFEQLLKFNDINYLNTHVCLTYNIASTVAIHGLSIYGGNPLTRGDLRPGNSLSIDLAGEFTLTQHWVAVMEGLFIYQEASSFHGFLGTPVTLNPIEPIKRGPHGRRRIRLNRLFPNRHNIGGEGIGSGNSDEFSLAPAIEYNFSENMGIISGIWFTVAGKNTPAFTMPVISFNVSW